jgi:hypothetical protein
VAIRLFFLFFLFSVDAKDNLKETQKIDNLVKAIINGYAGHGAMDFFVDFFEDRAKLIKKNADYAFSHRLKIGRDKPYNVEIQYQYFISMAKKIKEIKPYQDLIDSFQINKMNGLDLEICKEDFLKTQKKFNKLARELASIQRNSPFR